jgi:hypothetical protein
MTCCTVIYFVILTAIERISTCLVICNVLLNVSLDIVPGLHIRLFSQSNIM